LSCNILRIFCFANLTNELNYNNGQKLKNFLTKRTN